MADDDRVRCDCCGRNLRRCAFCGEAIHPGQKYFSAPRAEHASCRGARDLGLALGEALFEKQRLAEERKALTAGSPRDTTKG